MRRDREVVVVEQSGSGALKWLALGAALGAGMALLFAPRSGRELREELRQGIGRLRSLADETMEELKDEVDPEEEQLRSMSDSADAWEGEDDAEEPPPPPRRAARRRGGALTAREELERRLEAARARRRAALEVDEPDEPDEEPVA